MARHLLPLTIDALEAEHTPPRGRDECPEIRPVPTKPPATRFQGRSCRGGGRDICFERPATGSISPIDECGALVLAVGVRARSGDDCEVPLEVDRITEAIPAGRP